MAVYAYFYDSNTCVNSKYR